MAPDVWSSGEGPARSLGHDVASGKTLGGRGVPRFVRRGKETWEKIHLGPGEPNNQDASFEFNINRRRSVRPDISFFIITQLTTTTTTTTTTTAPPTLQPPPPPPQPLPPPSINLSFTAPTTTTTTFYNQTTKPNLQHAVLRRRRLHLLRRPGRRCLGRGL
jgi:hypothetical protein